MKLFFLLGYPQKKHHICSGLSRVTIYESMLAEEIKLQVLSEKSIVLEVGKTIDLTNHQRVLSLQAYLLHLNLPAIVEMVPAYCSLTVYFEPRSLVETTGQSFGIVKTFAAQLRTALEDFQEAKISTTEGELIRIPVCYEPDFAPDLERVANLNGLSTSQVVALHSSPTYHVFQIGFSPGFPYLGVLPAQIATPRLEQPRLKVPAGAVAIGGQQTGIYSMESPGGWNIIGRTPVQLFDAEKDQPSLLKAGDLVQFYPISLDTFLLQSQHKSTMEA